ncbi:MAG: DsbA family protein [Akkermansiaceae bacterium]|nr:DsbA family protein [Armatimonadota bacterium]
MYTPPRIHQPESRAVAELGAHLGTLTTITLWHDFLCPWCWVALIQAEKLKAEFGVTFDWRGAELFPPALNYKPGPPKPVDPNAPPSPKTRFDLFVEAEGIVMPTPRPPFVNMHPALLASEYVAVTQGAEKADAFIAAVYRAYWENQADVADPAVLARLAESVDVSAAPLLESVRRDQYVENILGFDDDAYAAGIRHVPTFVFGGEERLAEAPYTSLAHATERFLLRTEKYKNS